MNEPILLQNLFRVIDETKNKHTVTLYNEKDEPLITFVLPGWQFLNDFVIDDPVLEFAIPQMDQIRIKINTVEDPEVIDPGGYYQTQIIINGKHLEDWLVDFEGATETKDGVTGLVPAPQAGDQDKYLRGDGTWSPVSGGGGSSSEAEDVHYDRSASGLSASNVQTAIDELAAEKLDKTGIRSTKNSIGSASNWNVGNTPTFTIENDSLVITPGENPSLTITPTTVVTDVVIN